MPALAQCWYTRTHVPTGRKHKQADGSFSSTCRHCHKPITSWAKGGWYPADGFNIDRLRESTSGRCIYVVDVIDEMIVARYPIDGLRGAAAIRDFKLSLRTKHGFDDPACTLRLVDSKDGAGIH